jgi:hypothetical protein
MVVLLLALLHLLLDAGPDLLLHLEDLDLRVHQLVEALEALERVAGLQHLLAVRQLDALQVTHDGVGQLRRVFDGLHGDHRLRRDALVELHVLLEGAVHGAHQRLDGHRVHGRLFDDVYLAQQELFVGHEACDLGAALALHQHLHGAVRQAQQLDDDAHGAHRVDVLGQRVVGLGLALGGEQDFLLVAHGLFQRVDGLLTPHEERDHHVREDDDVSQGEQRDHPRVGPPLVALLVVVVFVEEHQGLPAETREQRGTFTRAWPLCCTQSGASRP